MTDKEYLKNIARLREIEESVKDPQFSLDNIDKLIEETKKIAGECYAYTRGLKEKVDSLSEIEMQ